MGEVPSMTNKQRDMTNKYGGDVRNIVYTYITNLCLMIL
jgi:hypothetical protein